MEIGQELYALGQLTDCVYETSDFVPRQVHAGKAVPAVAVFDQDLEGRPQTVHLDLAPQFALLARDAVHDVARYVAEVLCELVSDGRLLPQQIRLVEVRLESPEAQTVCM